ncbi:hypothetical protein [Plastoroseomonas arctica]|uniref:Transmembrane protein n=1 Tax=Plastoroseomonas arctica TaxID=1509237 RepID=A0AAF1JXW8_9PROT|nr:hypothetical protein [Plastoroseomonas arctica]MBR0656222.1 hypothetical protein [Plastoroseomonas arctica]
MLRAPLLVLAFAIVLLEETIWRWARALGGVLARIPIFAALERLVPRMDPRLVLALFLIPIALLFPVKLTALWLIGTGHVFTGVALIVAAKMLGTAFSARLYTIAEPRLMQLPLFVRLRGLVTRLLARAHAYLDASPAWQSARRAMARAKQSLRDFRLRHFGGGGFAAALASVRRRFRAQP